VIDDEVQTNFGSARMQADHATRALYVRLRLAFAARTTSDARRLGDAASRRCPLVAAEARCSLGNRRDRERDRSHGQFGRCFSAKKVFVLKKTRSIFPVGPWRCLAM
jgi:hypothetical protein